MRALVQVKWHVSTWRNPTPYIYQLQQEQLAGVFRELGRRQLQVLLETVLAQAQTTLVECQATRRPSSTTHLA